MAATPVFLCRYTVKRGLRRYRVGDYRFICDIQDEEIAILVLELGHRKDVYR